MALAALQRAPATPEKKLVESPKKMVDASKLQLGKYVADEDTGHDWWHSLSPYHKDTNKMRWAEWRLRRYGLVNDRPVGQPLLEQQLCSSGLALCFRTGWPFAVIVLACEPAVWAGVATRMLVHGA